MRYRLSYAWRKKKLTVAIFHLVRVERLYEDIRGSIVKKNIQADFQLNKLPLVISRVTALMGILVCICWILTFIVVLIIGYVLSLMMPLLMFSLYKLVCVQLVQLIWLNFKTSLEILIFVRVHFFQMCQE